MITGTCLSGDSEYWYKIWATARCSNIILLPLPFALCLLPLLPPLLPRIPLPTNQGPQALALAPLYLESFVPCLWSRFSFFFVYVTSSFLFFSRFHWLSVSWKSLKPFFLLTHGCTVFAFALCHFPLSWSLILCCLRLCFSFVFGVWL